MYRDELEALREQLGDLDRRLARARACRPPPPPRIVPWKRLIIALAGALVLAEGAAGHRRAAERAEAHAALVAQMSRTVLARDLDGLRTWTGSSFRDRCTINLRPPCRAQIICGSRQLYDGTGACGPDGFVDRGDSWLDGTPQCHIDLPRKRAVVRNVALDGSDDGYRTRGEVVVVIE
jgi:hypothetical protein